MWSLMTEGLPQVEYLLTSNWQRGIRETHRRSYRRIARRLAGEWHISLLPTFSEENPITWHPVYAKGTRQCRPCLESSIMAKRSSGRFVPHELGVDSWQSLL